MAYRVEPAEMENGHVSPSHFALPDELSAHIQWREELENDKSRRGRATYYSIVAVNAIVTAVLLSRYYVSLLLSACIAYNTFISTHDAHAALKNGIFAASTSALFIEFGYLFTLRKSTVSVPILKSRAYVEGGPINYITAAYFLFLVAAITTLAAQLFQFQNDCDVKRDSSYNVTITLCNN